MLWPWCEFRMHVWNVLHATRWKYRTQKSRQKSPSWHHPTTLSGSIFATKAYIDNRKKKLLSSNISSTCPHSMVGHWPTFLVMAAMRSRCGRYILIMWLLLSSFSSPNLNRRRLDVYHFHTWCGLSANLECMSEICCTRLAENTGRKNDAKNRHLGAIPQICRAISLQRRHVSTIGKKTC